MVMISPALLIGLAVLGVAALAIVGAAQAKKRREGMARVARRHGWRFDPASDSQHDERFRQFPIFVRGHGRRAYNTLTGEVEIGGRSFSVRAGDFAYKVTTSTGKGSSTTTYRFSYVILRLPWRGIPEFRIRPEGLFDKLASALGFDDIDFESEEFSRRFHVSCKDKRFAYDVISPKMMEFLLAAGVMGIEIDGGCACLSDGSRCWPPEDFDRHLRWLGRFFELWPEFLVKDLDGRERGAT